MAKKKRRSKKIRLSAAQLVRPGVTEADIASTPAQQAANLEEEYSHIARDLKRLGIVAAPLLVVVIVLVLVLA